MKNLLILFTVLVLTVISFGSCNNDSAPAPEVEIPLPNISVSIKEAFTTDDFAGFRITIKLSNTGAVKEAGILYTKDPIVPDNSPQLVAFEGGKDEYYTFFSMAKSYTFYIKAFVSDGKVTKYSKIYELKI